MRREHRSGPWSLLVPLTAALAGLMFAAGASTARGTDLRTTGTDLPGIIRSEAAKVDRQASRVAAVRAEIDQIQASTQDGPQLSALRSQREALSAPAGMTAVNGPAVRVELDDSPYKGDSLPEGYTVDDVVVHQQDVQGVVNALWSAGAEAMMIQDQRVISTSAVRCVGNTLILQGRVYSPPFVITAIGDVEQLQQGLVDDPSVATYRDYVARLGLGYQVSTLQEVAMPAYEGSVELQHARRAR
nr:DUF881 domain-containing protein [Gephyromycinifex aptenodytis]